MSRSVKLVLTVYAWWALTVLPGVLTLAGVFGDIGPESELGGSVVWVWILCYCAQLGMVYVVAWAVGHVRAWWFLVASMLPWVVDWGVPYGYGVGLVVISVAGLFAALMLVTSLRAVRLDEGGRHVSASVVKVLPNRMNVVVNNVYIRRKVLLDIPAEDGTTYQAVLHMLCEIGTQPDPGDKIDLVVDPRNRKHFAVAPTARTR